MMERDLPISPTDNVARRRWTILAVSLLAQTAGGMPLQGFPTLAYFLQQDLEPGVILSRVQIGTLVTVTALTSATGAFASGALADVFGVKRLLLLGQALIGISFILLGFAPSYSAALLILPLSGIGMSMITPSLNKVVMYWFAARLRATVMSIKQTGIPLAGALAAATLPSLAVAFGWRVAVIVLGIGVATSGVACLKLYRDYPNAALSAESPRLSGLEGLRKVLANKPVILTTIALLPMVFLQLTLMTYLVLYLYEEKLVLSVVAAGFFLSLVQLGGVGGRIAYGALCDSIFRAKRRATLVTITALAAASLLVTAALPAGIAGWQLAVAMIVLGVTTLSWQGVYWTHLGELSGKELTGTATGVNLAILQIGAMAGPPFFGFVVDQAGSYRLAWLIMGACCILCVPLLFFPRQQRQVSEC